MKLVNYITIISGGTPKTNNSDYWNGDIPWISIKDFNNMSRYILKTEKYITKLGLSKSSTNLLNVGDIIISARGTVGCISQLNSAMAFNQSCYGIRTNSHNLIQDYLYYWLKANNYKLLQNVHGAVFDTITKNTFDSLDINLPSLQYQQHIVDIIGSIDNKIENNNKLYNKLLDYLLIVYKKIRRKKSNITFKDAFLVFNGFAFKSSDYTKDGNYKVITIKNIKDDGFNTNNAEQILFNDHYKNYKLYIGDILLTMTGDVGRVDVVNERNCLLNQRVLKVSGISKAYTLAFLKDNYKKIASISKGSVQQNLSVKDLEKIEIPHTIEDINDFEENDYIFDYMLSLKIENRKLKNLKENFLKKFFD